MRARLASIAVLALLSGLTTAFLCLPYMPAPALPAPQGSPPGSFAPQTDVVLSSSAVSTPADLQFTLSVPAGDLMPTGVAIILPSEWTVASDIGVTDGATVGAVHGTFTATNDYQSSPTCSTTVDFAADLFDATTVTTAVSYPAFLNVLAPGVHRARYHGVAEVEGLTDVQVNILVDRLADGRHQIVVIAGDPTVAAAFGANRMCSPWSFNLTLQGVASSAQTVYSNPASPGAYTVSAVLASERDADLDGVSNGQDNCPLADNTTQADTDQDFIGNVCDPLMNTQQLDYDGDTLPNGFDNCPLVANTSQADGDFDDVGDTCDPQPGTPDGAHYVLRCDKQLYVGTSGSSTATCADLTEPITEPQPTPTPGPDSDGDGCADSRELGSNETLGGRRDPAYFWDFFDVTADHAIDLTDALLILQYFGAHADDPNAQLLDRQILDQAQPWRTSEANDGIDLQDALVNLKSFGHICL